MWKDISEIDPWASYQIRKIAGCACAENAGNVFPATDIKGNRQLAIPACITTRASRTCRDARRDRWLKVAWKTFLAFPAHAQPAILRIWQAAHGRVTYNANNLIVLINWRFEDTCDKIRYQRQRQVITGFVGCKYSSLSPDTYFWHTRPHMS